MRLLAMACALLSIVATTVVAHADITIGVNLSTTGPVASIGIPNKNAILLGPQVIAGQKVRYIFLDDASDPTAAVQNVKRLISEENIDILLGPSVTPTSLGVIDTVAEAKIPMISFGSASVLVAPVDAKRRWVFKTIANDDVFNSAMVSHMVKKGVKKVSVIAIDDPYGESNVRAYKKFAELKGIETLTVEKFKRNDTSATAQVLRALNGKPDAVFVIAAGTPAVMPHRGLIERGFKGVIYQTGGAANSDFLRLGGKEVDGAYLPASPFIVAEQLPDGYPTKKAALEFIKLYESKYGARSAFAPFPWDALKLVEAAVPVALKQAKPGTVQFREALREALEKTKGFAGASAVYTMSPTDHSGIDNLGMSVIRIENGKWKLEEHTDFK
jgi:branched-chain amino acid transport system substrate-binding protein